jgi:hypothetical protein
MEVDCSSCNFLPDYNVITQQTTVGNRETVFSIVEDFISEDWTVN